MRRKETPTHLFVAKQKRNVPALLFSFSSLHSQPEILHSSYKTIADYIYHIYLCLPEQESFYKQQQLCKNNISVGLTLSYVLLNYITTIFPCTFHYFSNSGPRMSRPINGRKKKSRAEKRTQPLKVTKISSIKVKYLKIVNILLFK